MNETKRVVLRVPADLPADGVHCGGCGMLWHPSCVSSYYCAAWKDHRLSVEDEAGPVRCPECLAAEEREQPESPAPICDACAPGECRCEEDRR